MEEEIVFELEWLWAGNDAVAKRDGLVFRLHEKYVNPRGHGDKSYRTYQLEIKKQKDITFKELGYTFYMPHYGYLSEKSVDKKEWKNIAEIAERAEEILEILGFIEFGGN